MKTGTLPAVVDWGDLHDCPHVDAHEDDEMLVEAPLPGSGEASADFLRMFVLWCTVYGTPSSLASFELGARRLVVRETGAGQS